MQPPRMTQLTVACVLALSAGSCSGGPAGDAGDAAPDLRCGPSVQPSAGRCVPVLDDCKDDDVPVPGGGCRRIGVRECDGGLEAPPKWTCKPVGPPTTCLTGWARVKGGWCEPILPAARCPDGTMQVIGKPTCQPVDDCGSGTYGKIKTTASTIFVDGSYSGGGSDGSQAKPYTTIAAAVQAAPASGGQIAVAAGTYNEDLIIDKSLALQGRCAQKVKIEGKASAPNSQALYVTFASASTRPAVTLAGLTVTGKWTGVVIDGAEATLSRLVVAGCGYVGIQAGYSKLLLKESLVADNRTGGMGCTGSSVVVERSVIRDTKPEPSTKAQGHGIATEAGGSTGATPSSLTLRDSVLVRNRHAGLWQSGGVVTVERSLIGDTLPRALDNEGGIGIHATPPIGEIAGWSTLTVRDTLLARNRHAGLWADEADVTVRRSVIRDTRLDTALDTGVGIYVGAIGPSRARLDLADSLVRGNAGRGVGAVHTAATVERTVIEQTRHPSLGYGIDVQSGANSRPSVLVLRDSVVRENGFIGVGVWSSAATLERVVVRDTRSVLGEFGDEEGTGLNLVDAKFTIKDVLVSSSRYAGLALYGGQVRVERTILRDTRPNSGNGVGGFGVFARPGNTGAVQHLELLDSRVDGSHGTGLGLYSVKRATVQRCLVTDTRTGKLPSPTGLQTGWGDGVTFTGFPGGTTSAGELKLEDTRVERSARVGLMLMGGSGSVARSIFRQATLPIALEGGSRVSIGKDNLFQHNTEDEVGISRGLKPTPPPSLPSK